MYILFAIKIIYQTTVKAVFTQYVLRKHGFFILKHKKLNLIFPKQLFKVANFKTLNKKFTLCKKQKDACKSINIRNGNLLASVFNFLYCNLSCNGNIQFALRRAISIIKFNKINFTNEKYNIVKLV